MTNIFQYGVEAKERPVTTTQRGLMLPEDKVKVDKLLYGPNGEMLIGPGAGSKDYLWNSGDHVRLSSAPAGLVVSAQGAANFASNLELNAAANAWNRYDVGQPGQVAVLKSAGGANTVEYWDTPAGANPAAITNRVNMTGLAFAAALNSPRVRLLRNTNLATAHATQTAIPWSNTFTNTVGAAVGAAAMWSAGTPGRVFAPIDGLYAVFAYLLFASSGAGAVRLGSLVANGAFVFGQGETAPIGGGNYTSLGASGIVGLTAGAYVEYWAYQDSGAALNVISNGTDTPQMEVYYLGPL